MVREQPVVSREGWRKPMAGMGRREVLRALGGAAVAWPIAARADSARCQSLDFSRWAANSNGAL